MATDGIVWSLEEDKALVNIVKGNPYLYVSDSAVKNKKRESWKNVASQLNLIGKSSNDCQRRFKTLHAEYVFRYRAGTLNDTTYLLARSMDFLRETIRPVRLQKDLKSPVLEQQPSKMKGNAKKASSIARFCVSSKKGTRPRSSIGIIKHRDPSATNGGTSRTHKLGISDSHFQDMESPIRKRKMPNATITFADEIPNAPPVVSNNNLFNMKTMEIPSEIDDMTKVVQPVPLFTATCIPPPKNGLLNMNGPNFLFSNYVASVLDMLPDSDSLIVRNKVHEILHKAQMTYFSQRPDKSTYLNNLSGELFEIECGNCTKVNVVQGTANEKSN